MVRFEFVPNGNRFARCVGEMDVEIGPICAKISFERMGNETFAESVKRIGQLVTNIERVILSRKAAGLVDVDSTLLYLATLAAGGGQPLSIKTGNTTVINGRRVCLDRPPCPAYF